MKANRTLNVFFLVILSLLIYSCKKDNSFINKTDQIPRATLEEYDDISIEKIETNNVSIHNDKSATKNVITTDVRSYDLKIIKSAKTKYQVKNIGKASEEIRNMVLENNGYVSEMRFENNRYRKQNVFVIKVPNYQFDGLLEKIGGISQKVDFENITTQDVTEAYLDAEARLKIKRLVKRRYEDILRTKAYKVQDLLDVEDKINDIQEEIEVVQGKLNYMKTKVALSSIQIELYESLSQKNKVKEEGSKFSKEISKALTFGVDMIKLLFLFIVYIWPILLIILMLFIIYKRTKK